MLAQVLQGYQPYLPFILVGALALAIIAVILLVFLGRKMVKQSRRRQALARPPAARPTMGERVKGVRGRWARFKLWVKGLFSGWRWNPADDMGMSFKQTLSVLKTYLPGRQPQYQIPWYLMVGADHSKRSDVLQDIDLELPIGRPEYSTDTDLAGVSWSFYDQGVVLDVDGRLFLDDKTVTSDGESWTRLLRLLNKYRAKRPLDGIILTLPAHEISGQDRLTAEEVSERARHIYAQLWKLQSITGMRVPVYVMVTNCETIPGFKSFVTEAPSLCHNEVFGWSSPYAAEAAFSSSWIDDMFAQLHQSMNRIRASLFTEGRVQDGRDGTLLFPAEFLTLRSGLENYLTGIFKESSYHESFFLRGVYFTGQTSSFDEDQVANSGIFAATQSLGARPEASKPPRRFVFLRDLFEKKIFREYALGKPIRRVLVSTSRLLNFVKAATAVIAAVWVYGIFHAHHTIEVGNQTLVPALSRVDHALQGINQRGGYSDSPRFRAYLAQQAESILAGFTTLDPAKTWALSMPSSWFSHLDTDIQSSFTAAYNHVILPSLYSALLKRVGETVSVRHVDYTSVGGTRAYVNPAFTPTFQTLNRYVQDISLLEDNIDVFNNLDATQDVKDLGKLIKFLFNKDLPKDFYDHSDYYKKALARIIDREIDLFQFKVMAGQKLGILFKNFLDESFNIRANLPVFIKLQEHLTQFAHLGGLRTLDDKNVREVTEEAIAVADIIAGGNMSWIDRASFEPSPDYTTMMNDISISRLLGLDMASQMSRIADEDFIKFKLKLTEFKSLLTGPFLAIRNNQIVSEPSSGLVNLIDAMTAFLSEPFMQRSDDRLITTKVSPGKILFWDEPTLVRATDVVEQYNTYVNQRLTQAPLRLQDIFKVIGRNSAKKKVSSLIAESQVFHEQPLNLVGFGAREVLHAQVQNVAAATPHFTTLLGMFSDGGFVSKSSSLRELLVKQNYGILEKIENLLEVDNLYNAREEAFEWWDGAPMVGLKAFGVHSINDMHKYLTAQRFRIQFLAKEMAEPILTLLSLGYLEDVPYDLPLVLKWSKIAGVLEDYDSQSPGNTLKNLEKFLTYDINEISLENCNMDDFGIDDFDATGDYFLEIRNRYYRSLYNRCEALAGRKAIDRFNRAASFFNVNLSGRFPFTKETKVTNEADPADVQTFFQLFDSLSEQDLTTILRASRFANAQDSLKEFIRKVESIRPLMLASLDRGMTQQIPEIRLDIQFRTNRDQEIGGDKIIDWSVDFGTQRIGYRDTDRQTSWRVGAPVDIHFRWALDSDSIPVPDPRLPQLEIFGTDAVFSYRGRWSLIRLIREHASPISTYNVSDSPGPQILAFVVPTAYNQACYQGHPPLLMDRKSESARVYCQLNLHIPIKDEIDAESGISAQKVKQLAVPRFPYEAPVVDRMKLTKRRY